MNEKQLLQDLQPQAPGVAAVPTVLQTISIVPFTTTLLPNIWSLRRTKIK
jgi:hypothetical protein